MIIKKSLLLENIKLTNEVILITTKLRVLGRRLFGPFNKNSASSSFVNLKKKKKSLKSL